MATFNSVSGEEPSTVTFKIATVAMTRNSTNLVQEIVTLGDAESSLGLARILATSPASTDYGLVTREAVPVLTSYAASTTGQSTATTIVASDANTKAYVYAYSVVSTLAGPIAWGLYRGSTRIWGGVLAAPSSGISGANLAVSPPAYLCVGSTGKALTFNTTSSNAGLVVSLGYWTA